MITLHASYDKIKMSYFYDISVLSSERHDQVHYRYACWTWIFESLSKFKNAIRLNSQSNKISVPKLYYYGPRKLNVILIQIRCTASFLNHDLHKVHILSSPACSCGAPQEDANHFFFVCTKYSEIRNELFLSTSDLSQSINTSLLTSGSETLSYADNCFIFDSVFPIHKKV